MEMGEHSRPGPIRVMVTDRRNLMAEAVQLMLGADFGFEVLAGPPGWEPLLAAIRAEAPHVVLADLEMAAPGLEALAAACSVPLVVVIGGANEAGVSWAMRVGAAGCVAKGGRPGELYRVLRAAARGEVCVSDDLPQSAPAHRAVRENLGAKLTHALGAAVRAQAEVNQPTGPFMPLAVGFCLFYL